MQKPVNDNFGQMPLSKISAEQLRAWAEEGIMSWAAYHEEMRFRERPRVVASTDGTAMAAPLHRRH
jgi:hypothetical protein